MRSIGLGKTRKILRYLYKIEIAEYYKTAVTGYTFQSEWLRIYPDGLIVVNPLNKVYAWDGCTFKIELFQQVIGVPDGTAIAPNWRITHRATILHDALMQFRDSHGIPMSVMTELFRLELKASGFIWADIYALGIKLYWSTFGAWFNKN